MDDNNSHHHHHHDLPPFPSAASTLPSPPPPQNSHLPPILSRSPLGFSSNPQSYFFTNPTHEQVLPAASHFPPSFLSSYGFPVGSEATNSLLPKDEGRRVLDAWSTKVARTKRRLARQRSLTLSRTSSSSSSSSGFDEYSKGVTITHYPNTDSQANNRNPNLFTFCTPDKKILRILLKKELKNSDVGSLGRIVLPKREAEDNLPFLSDKEGIQIVMRDVNSNRRWAMKYKYWANNRSRMYVLENTGDFVRQNGLLMGDSMTLYEDECKNLYVSVEKGGNNSSLEENYEMRKQQQQQCAATAGGYTSNMDNNNNNINIKDEEEEASLALLIEELKHKTEDDHLIQQHQQQPPCNNNNVMIVSQNSDSSCFERGSSGSYKFNNNNNGKEVMEDLHGINNGFEDCFGGLDTLPEVSGFKFPLFDCLSDDKST